MNILDKETGKIEKILNRTSNSYLITQTKLTSDGINCDHWFTERAFLERFHTLKSYAKESIEKLDKCDPKDFARTYIDLRTKSFHMFHNKLILSSSHGIGYFENIIKFYDSPTDYCPKPNGKYDYEYNFTKLLLSNTL